SGGLSITWSGSVFPVIRLCSPFYQSKQRHEFSPRVQPAPGAKDAMTTAGQIYQNIAALEPVKRILEEADKALNDRGRTIATSDIPEVLGGIAGGAIGVGVGLTLIYTSGVAGVSAAGI